MQGLRSKWATTVRSSSNQTMNLAASGIIRVVPLALDVYVLSGSRDRAAIDRFLDHYVDVDASADRGDEQLMVLPIDHAGPENDPALDHWDWVNVRWLDDAIEFGLTAPPRAFRVYLRSKAKDLCGALLCFTRSGEIVFGVSVDDPLCAPDALDAARRELAELERLMDGYEAWIVAEAPPPLDPRQERPWESPYNLAVS